MPSKTILLPDFPYRFDLLLQILKRFAYPARQIVHQNQLWRFTQGKLTTYSQVDSELVIQSVDTPLDSTILTTASHIFGLNANHTAFYEYARLDAQLWQVVEPLVGLPIFCTETIFEALITLIIEQHITWKNALRSQRTLMEILNTGHTNGEVTVYDFPAPEQLARTTPQQLKPLKITNRRIELILRLARDVADGKLDLEAMRQMEAADMYSKLLEIKGVGHWTAANVLSRALGVFPHISHNDVALQAAVQHYFYQDVGKKSAQQVIDTLQPFGEFAGLVGHLTLLRWVLDRYPIVD